MSRKKVIVTFITFSVTAILIAVAFFVIRNINEKPPISVDQTRVPISEEEISNTPQQEIFTSTFMGVDTVHWGQGGAKITASKDANTLSFGDDFKVAQGPDLFVYLSPNEAGQDLGEFASLGQLKANEGAQEYILPSNYNEYKTIVIWCRAFNVTFATAEFDFNS